MSVEACGFMAGSWSCEVHGGTFQEMWSPPAGGMMVGHGRLIVEGKTRFAEFLSIEEDENFVVTMYIVLGALSQGPKTPAAFRLVESGPGFAAFEREGDDFPQRIAYEESPEGLPCRLSSRNGRTELYDFK